MVDEFLNQDEIDALLSGAPGGGTLTPEDLSILGEVANLVANASGNVVGMLAGRGVSATVGGQSEAPQSTLKDRLGDTLRVFTYSMIIGGLDDAPVRLVTGERGALALADLMMGGDAKELPGEANDLYLSAAGEGLSQLVGSALTNLSGLLGGARLVADASSSSLDEKETSLPFADEPGDLGIWAAQIVLEVEDVEPFDLLFVMPVDTARLIADKVREKMNPEPAAPATRAAELAPAAHAAPGSPAKAAERPGTAASMPQAPPVDVKPVEFASLGTSEYAGAPGNIDLIVDIPVRITVELGRTRKTIGEVLALGPGSVVELNKMAGEPVDVLVNGKLIARGEVVVIDESFGIRVTEVVSKAERIRSMGV